MAVFNATGGSQLSVTNSPAFHKYPSSGRSAAAIAKTAPAFDRRFKDLCGITASAVPIATNAAALKGDMRPLKTLNR